MEKKLVNPWQWQDGFGYAQAVEVTQLTRTLYVSGQAAMDAQGNPSDGDMAAQVALSMDNLETVLTEAGYSLADIVRLNVYTTSIADLMPQFGLIVGRLAPHGCRPSSTVVEVSALAFPSLRVEIEVTAVK